MKYFIITTLMILSLSIYDCKKSNLPKGILELVSSRHGELSLIEEKKGDLSSKKIFFQDQSIYESELGKTFSLFQSFQINEEDVLVFLKEDMRNPSCVKFFIASVRKGPDIEILPEIGNCHEAPEITQEQGKINFQFPNTETEISQTVVYENRKIEVTESKLSKK